MNRVVILSRQDDLTWPLQEQLRQRVSCDVVAADRLDTVSTSLGTSANTFFVVDAECPQEPIAVFLSKIGRTYPSANVIMLRGIEHSSDGTPSPGPCVHEILNRPANVAQMPRTADLVARSIMSFNATEELQARLRKEMGRNQIVAKSKPMREIMESLPRLAHAEATILIEGETGTGKELIARALHYLGPRAGGPFVTIDCGSIPDQLIENELFGHARGAYTGATGPTGGLLHEAEGGTVLLDEVEALSLPVQTRFLRFLQDRRYRPLGQAAYVNVSTRVLASSNVELEEAVRQKSFREDLFYRLSVVRVSIPPLRDRKSDIPSLINHFVGNYARNPNVSAEIPEELLEQWMEYEWPGNVRELENRVQEWILRRTIDATAQWSPLHPAVPAYPAKLSDVRDEALERTERLYFQRLLNFTKGNISQAAKLAGIDRKNLAILLKKRGLDAMAFRR